MRLGPAAESAVRQGHPWVYTDRIKEQNRAGNAGELAVIYDRQDRFLALGLYDPDSAIGLRILHVGKPVTVTPDWWRERLRASRERRRGLFDDQTTGYRWIHGENDGWPGLVLDRYEQTVVLKLYSTVWLSRLTELVPMLFAEFHPDRLILRLSRNIQEAAAKAGLGDGFEAVAPGPEAGDVRFVTATADPVIVFQESGLRFEAEVVRGQKTGFYLDQRENRRRVETYAAGRDVLNAFSFSGGFSLYAARGGARSLTDLDISAHALASAKRNVALNLDQARITGCRHESVQADCFDWLATGPRREFDLIILDPPSLARREHERAGAIQAYGKLAASGIGRLRPGGILLSASCSAHVTEGEFFGVVRDTARRSGRHHSELCTTRHAPDHPATFPEAWYLKAIYLQF